LIFDFNTWWLALGLVMCRSVGWLLDSCAGVLAGFWILVLICWLPDLIFYFNTCWLAFGFLC
jgi:hypothetical protein